jgi:hypothetical protein
VAGPTGHDHLERKPADAPHPDCVKCGSTDAPAASPALTPAWRRLGVAHQAAERCHITRNRTARRSLRCWSRDTVPYLAVALSGSPKAGSKADPVCCRGRPRHRLVMPIEESNSSRRALAVGGTVQGFVHRAQAGIDGTPARAERGGAAPPSTLSRRLGGRSVLCSSNAPAGTRDQYPDLPDAKLVAARSNTRPHQNGDVHLEDSVFALRLSRTHRRGSARAAARCGAVAPRGREGAGRYASE